MVISYILFLSYTWITLLIPLTTRSFSKDWAGRRRLRWRPGLGGWLDLTDGFFAAGPGFPPFGDGTSIYTIKIYKNSDFGDG